MIKKYYLIIVLLLITTFSFGQEVVTLGNYNGTVINVSATSTVNDDITIVFEDADIIANFYTDFQTEIYMYGGLDTPSGGFQGAPFDFTDLSLQPNLVLFNDTDVNAGPNTYSITINLAEFYSSVPDGTMVFGFNLLFQNQFGGGGNNQTVDLYIDLSDAMKDSTLSTIDVENSVNLTTSVTDKVLKIATDSPLSNVRIYNLLGQAVYFKNLGNENQIFIDLTSEADGIYIIKIQSEDKEITRKILLN